MEITKVQSLAFGLWAMWGRGPTHFAGKGMQADSPYYSHAPGSRLSELLKDEALAGDISAYIDGRLKGDALSKMKKMLASDPSLAQEVAELRRVNESLKTLGAEILDEPVPAALISTLRGSTPKN